VRFNDPKRTTHLTAVRARSGYTKTLTAQGGDPHGRRPKRSDGGIWKAHDHKRGTRAKKISNAKKGRGGEEEIEKCGEEFLKWPARGESRKKKDWYKWDRLLQQLG